MAINTKYTLLGKRIEEDDWLVLAVKDGKNTTYVMGQLYEVDGEAVTLVGFSPVAGLPVLARVRYDFIKYLTKLDKQPGYIV